MAENTTPKYDAPSPEETAAFEADAPASSPRGMTETDAYAAAWDAYLDAQMDRDVVDFDDAFGL